jgi:ADP-heptose:LPS heptosyltransferase
MQDPPPGIAAADPDRLPGAVTPSTPSGARPTPSRRTAGRPLAVVLRALGLGDFLTGLPALRAVRRSFPDHRLVLCAPEVLGPLAALSGAVDAVCDAEPLGPLDPGLSGADLAVNLHGRGPQSHRRLLELRPRRLVAFAHPAIDRSRGGPAWRPREHEVRRWCRLLDESGIPADPDALDLAVPPGPVPEVAREATLLHPGAASGARRWPVERWAEVARREGARGRRVVVTGGSQERGLGMELAELAGLDAAMVLTGCTDLIGLAGVVAAAARVVVGDTGVAHLATALGTPSVVVFGPTSPQEWGPPPDRPRHRVLWAGSVGDPHAPTPDPGLLRIQPAEVLGALDVLDAAGPVGHLGPAGPTGWSVAAASSVRQ